MHYQTLVDVKTLMQHLGDPVWRIFDCRCSPADPEAGRRAYLEGHILGARHADMDRVLAATPMSHTGRHPLPERELLGSWLGAEGVGGDTQIVAYDDAGGAFAARLWWLARWLGHDATAVLNGGLDAWRAAGGSLEQSDTAVPVAADFPVREPLGGVVDVQDVLAIVRGARRGRLVDARSRERYTGETEPLDPVAGHIPGALNLPFAGNLKPDKTFRSRDELRARFGSAGFWPEEAVHYCGSGVTACHNILAMEYAGLSGSTLYPGSWSQWIRDPERPVERGARPG